MNKKIIGVITYQPKKREHYKLIRTVTTKECPWLYRTFKIGEIVYRYFGYTYKLIGEHGSAFSKDVDIPPFFELPNDAVSIVI
ncbi:MAG: hypothetical protein ABI308_02820 [Mucilaginibacter sp.]